MRKRDKFINTLSWMGWVFIIFGAIFLAILPNNLFFLYTNIEPVQIEVGKEVIFKSTFKQSIPVPLHYTDTLHKKNGGGLFPRYDQSKSTGGFKVTNGFREVLWTYDEGTPTRNRFTFTVPGDYMLISEIRACIIYPLCKWPQIVETRFTVEEVE